ncbi:MAG: ATP-dependent sacrificial sulfur transferase LarE [Nitrospirae bacterium]|nr:ATP-dependent sacrificial sulfur transferase LarE [Nitrospirota bacterium]MBI5696582.1 ATP-dependent sacrificial sulfur transferase LarE [Nitrospirota bacterium]
MEKYRGLVEYIRGLGPSAVAFSGGVDSGLVAKAAFDALGDKALAVTVVSELCPEEEAADAAGLARAIGIRHTTITVSILGDDKVADNPPERCYHCKGRVFASIREAALAEGIGTVLDGTNAEDTTAYRPGLRALKEAGVISPLAALGFTKADIRIAAKKLGLPNWDRPSAPCSATRFPYGTRLTVDALERVRAAESFIRSQGFRVVRVRDYSGSARIEVEAGEVPRLAAPRMRKKVVAKLTGLGYNYVTLDMEGYRSGSMDAAITTGNRTLEEK